MQNTTRSSVPALETISATALFDVNGGCHKRRCGGGGCSPTMIFQMPQIMMPQMFPQAQQPAQAQVDPAAQQLQQQPQQPQYGGYPGYGGDQVSTSVSINGQQQPTA